MKRFFNNALFAFLEGLSIDLLFWVVVSSLFLTTVKGLSSFQFVLIYFVGGIGCLLFYPLLMFIISKMKRYYCSVLANFLLLLSIILFTVCNTIYGFFIAQFVYEVAYIFKSVRTVMLKHNLEAQQNENGFVKWRSLASLAYAIVTCIIASFAGNLFNINPYIPMYCSISMCVLAFVLSFFYKEPKEYENLKEQAPKFNFEIFKNKRFLLMSITLVLTMGTLMFYHKNNNLLLQTIMQGSNMQLSTITLIISYVVLISRLFRIIGIYLFPLLYKKVDYKTLLVCGILTILSGVFYSLGACVNMGLAASIAFAAIGLMILISVRDFFVILFEQIGLQIVDEKHQTFLVSMLQVLQIFGKLFINAIALLLMLKVSLNWVYLILMIFILIGFVAILFLLKSLNQKEYIKHQE